MKRWSQSLLSPALYFVLAVAMFWPVLMQIQQVVIGSPYADVLSMFYPLRAFANAEMQLGRWPLWNPYILCGHPIHGEGQGAIFYPLNLGFALLSPQVSMNLYALLHFAAAGIFFFFYMRACGLGRFSAFFAGFAYMFSSGPISRLYAGHFTIIPFLALVPALMWAWQAWRNNPGWGKAGWGALAIGGMILAGYPQMLLYASMYFGLHMLVELIVQYRKWHDKRALSPLWFYIVVMALGVGVGAVQLLPSYVFAKESFREQVTYDFIASFSFAPENMLTLLLPNFFGPLGKGLVPYWGRNFLWEMWIYIGVFPLALAIMSMLRMRRERNATVFAHTLAILIFFILALGRHTPLHRFLYDYVPFFNYFRGSSKFSYFVLFSLAALSGLGAESLLNVTQEKQAQVIRKSLLIILIVFAAIGVVMAALFGIGHSASDGALGQFLGWILSKHERFIPSRFFDQPDVSLMWRQAFPQIIKLLVLAVLGIAVIAAWPWIKKRNYLAYVCVAAITFPEMVLFAKQGFETAPVTLPFVPSEFLSILRQDPAHPRVLSPELDRNAFLPYGIQSPLGYVGNMTTRYNNFLTASLRMNRQESMVNTPVQQLSNEIIWPAVYYLILPDGNKLPANIATPLITDQNRILYRFNRVQTRTAFAGDVIRCGSIDEALSALESQRIDLFKTTILEGMNGQPAPDFEAAKPGDSAQIEEILPRKTVIRTRASGARLLVLADSFESGWQCKMDDREKLPIYPVNVGFRGVVVPGGDHTVTFTYQPRSYVAGAAMSILSLIAILVAGLVLPFLPKKRMDTIPVAQVKESSRSKTKKPK